jgi:hypothetical protein
LKNFATDTRSLLSNFSLMEHQATNLWVCSFIPKTSFLLNSPLRGVALAHMPFVAQTVEIPTPGVSVERQHGINFIADEDIQNVISMEIYETENWIMFNFFKSWLGSFYNAKDRYFDFSKFPNGEFKIDLLISFFSKVKIGTTANWLSMLQGMTPSKFILLQGVFPTKVETLQLSYASGDALKLNVTLAVDSVVDETNDPSGILKLASLTATGLSAATSVAGTISSLI